MKTIEDLNNALFEQLDRLIKPNLSQDELKFEINRTRSIVNLSAQIISNLIHLQKVKEIEHKSNILPFKQKEY